MVTLEHPEILFPDRSTPLDLLAIGIPKVPLGMSDYQVKHFVMNFREFPTPFAQYAQSKLEVYSALNAIWDMYYNCRKALLDKALAECEIERLMSAEQTQRTEIEIELQRLEIEKCDFAIANLRLSAMSKLAELKSFMDIYKTYQYLEDESAEALSILEDESWRIKSAYFSDIQERYGLSPGGFGCLPHQMGGIEALLKLEDKNGEVDKSNSDSDR